MVQFRIACSILVSSKFVTSCESSPDVLEKETSIVRVGVAAGFEGAGRAL
jgi:hypothetical protein